MWMQAAMALAQSVQNEQNRRRNLASNVITQKYSPWTGARADFSQQGNNQGASTLMKGLGAGMMQDQQDAMMAKQVNPNVAQSTAATDGDWYAKLSANPASVGVSPINRAGALAEPVRAPAVEKGNVSSFSPEMFNQYQDPTPLMLQGNPNQGQNPWLSLAAMQAITGKAPAQVSQVPAMRGFDYGKL